MPQDLIDDRDAPAEGAPRPLEDEQLEAVAGGGSWTISFDCCADSFAVSGATFDDALSQARTAHDQSNPTHGSSASYSAS